MRTAMKQRRKPINERKNLRSYPSSYILLFAYFLSILFLLLGSSGCATLMVKHGRKLTEDGLKRWSGYHIAQLVECWGPASSSCDIDEGGTSVRWDYTYRSSWAPTAHTYETVDGYRTHFKPGGSKSTNVHRSFLVNLDTGLIVKWHKYKGVGEKERHRWHPPPINLTAFPKATPYKFRVIKLFEGPKEAPGANERAYAARFHAKSTRFIHAEFKIRNLYTNINAQVIHFKVRILDQSGREVKLTSTSATAKKNWEDFSCSLPVFGSSEFGTIPPGQYTVEVISRDIHVLQIKFTVLK
jgi:hypothetical protein